MIACPKCGADTHTIDTRDAKGGTRRRRVCTNANCAFRVTTVEVILPDPRRGRMPRDPVIVSRAQLATLTRALEAPVQWGGDESVDELDDDTTDDTTDDKEPLK